MIKYLSLAKRKAGMSVEDFQTHWREIHGPLAARTPGLRRYIQSPVLPEMYDSATPPEYDGIAETWWDSVQAVQQARETPEWRAAGADASNFIGKGSVHLYIKEVPVVDDLPSVKDREGMVKYVSYVTPTEAKSGG